MSIYETHISHFQNKTIIQQNCIHQQLQPKIKSAVNKVIS